MTAHLSIPGHHERRALASVCPECGTTNEPAAVLDREDRTREAAYNCQFCPGRWTRTKELGA